MKIHDFKQAFSKISRMEIFRQPQDIVLLALALILAAFTLFRIWGTANVKAPTLVFTHFWEEREELLETLKNEFEELHPDIKISLDFRPYEELRLKFSEDINGITADIIVIDPLWKSSLAAGEPVVEEIPLLTYFHPLLYNIDILTKAGFSRPPKTRTEFLTQARAVSDPEAGHYGTALALGPDNIRGIYRDLYSWIWAAGILLADLEKPAQGSRVPAETRVLAETLEFLALLQQENVLFPGTFSMGEDEKKKAFLEGRIAFMIGSAEDLPSLRRRPGEITFDYTTIPTPDSYTGKPVFGSGGWSLAVLPGSRYQDKARSFIDFLLEQSSRLAEGWAIPESENRSYPEESFYSKAWELYISGDLIRELAEPGENEPEDSLKAFSRDTVFREELIDLYEGKNSPAEAAGIIQKRLQERW